MIKGIIATATILLGFIPLFLWNKHKNAKISLIVSATLLVSVVFSSVYWSDFALKPSGNEKSFSGTVIESVPVSSYTERATVILDEIDGEHARNRRVTVYINKSEINTFLEGKEISFIGCVSRFSSDDAKEASYAKGICATLECKEITQISSLDSLPNETRFNRLREDMTRYATYLSDKDSGALVSALLIGERDMLPDKTNLAFRRIGISHLLALSGMHLAILSLGLNRLLLLLGVGKRPASFIIILFSLAYMALTGFSVSITRAGIMLIVSSAMFILSNSRDSLTSLALATVIIILSKPYSIYDVSLPLTVLATFGILILGALLRERKKKQLTLPKKILDFFVIGLCSSVFAIIPTLLTTLSTFGTISLLSCIATLIFSVLIEIIMYLGVLLLLFGGILPIGALLSPTVRLTENLAQKLSSLEHAYVITSDTLIPALALFLTCAFAVFVSFRIKNKKAFVTGLVLGFIVLNCTVLVSSVVTDKRDCAVYLSDGKCDRLLIRSGGEVSLIVSSSFVTNNAYGHVDTLEALGTGTLDNLIITRYSFNLDDEIKTLSRYVLIDSLFLPSPQNETESVIFKNLCKTADEEGLNLYEMICDEALTLGEARFIPIYTSPYGESAYAAYRVDFKDKQYTYISSSILESGIDITSELNSSDVLIAGGFGKKYKRKHYLSYLEELDMLIINSEYLFLKIDDYQRLNENGCEIKSHPLDMIYLLSE